MMYLSGIVVSWSEHIPYALLYREDQGYLSWLPVFAEHALSTVSFFMAFSVELESSKAG